MLRHKFFECFLLEVCLERFHFHFRELNHFVQTNGLFDGVLEAVLLIQDVLVCISVLQISLQQFKLFLGLCLSFQVLILKRLLCHLEISKLIDCKPGRLLQFLNQLRLR